MIELHLKNRCFITFVQMLEIIYQIYFYDRHHVTPRSFQKLKQPLRLALSNFRPRQLKYHLYFLHQEHYLTVEESQSHHLPQHRPTGHLSGIIESFMQLISNESLHNNYYVIVDLYVVMKGLPLVIQIYPSRQFQKQKTIKHLRKDATYDSTNRQFSSMGQKISNLIPMEKKTQSKQKPKK